MVALTLRGTVRTARCPWLAHATLKLLFSFAFGFAGPIAHSQTSADATPPIRSASEVLSLSTEEADRPHAVIIRGVVTGATEYGIFVQDQTAGIWVQTVNADRQYSSGELVEITGKSGAGLFSPDLIANRVIKLGHAPLPSPKNVALKSLLAGNENDQFISVTGVVRSVDLRPNVSQSQRVWLDLVVEGNHIFATLPAEDAANAERLRGAEVRITAAAACTKNAERQITSVVLSTTGLDHVEVIKPPLSDLFNAPLLPVRRLLQYRVPVAQDGRVRIKGIVTYAQVGEHLILQDGGRATLVRSTERTPVNPGDEIEAVGYPAAAPSGPFLDDAIYRFVQTAAVPPAHLATLEELSSGRLNYNLVTITGKLLHHVNDSPRQELLLEEGTTSISAELYRPVKNGSLDWLRDGSIVRITGISILTVEGSWNQGGPAASVLHYHIMLRSPDDITEVSPPSWWSAKHLFYIASIFAVFMLLFLGLALYVRLQHWRLETITNERERVAHEIHDTLAQSFAGIGFQLQAIRRAIPNGNPVLLHQVDLARALVRHSHKEARQSIDPRDLRKLEDVDVLDALSDSARKLVEGGHVVIDTRREGSSRSLPSLIKDVLLHVGQEAVANAIRHGEPTQIAIIMEFQEDAARLTVTDDGSGFVERGDVLGFGLRGMRKRAASVGGYLSVDSQLGGGTSVTLLCPLPSNAITKLFYSWTSGVK